MIGLRLSRDMLCHPIIMRLVREELLYFEMLHSVRSKLVMWLATSNCQSRVITLTWTLYMSLAYSNLNFEYEFGAYLVLTIVILGWSAWPSKTMLPDLANFSKAHLVYGNFLMLLGNFSLLKMAKHWSNNPATIWSHY